MMLQKYIYKLLNLFNYNFVIPRNLRLECSSHCQLRCPSCPTTTGHIHPVIGSGFLKFDDFKKLVDENTFIRSIELSNYGEIFLNPDFIKILEYSYKHGIRLSANNGVNLNGIKEEIPEALVKYEFRSISCSIDGTSQETYKIYRVRGNFDNVIHNIKKINYYKNLYNSSYPELTWQFIVFGHNEHQIEEAKKLARELNMNIETKLNWDPDYSPIRNTELVKQKIQMDVSNREEYLNIYKKEYLENICNQLWDRPQINWDGKVLGCCRNFWGDFGDNVFDSGLVKAINNPKINYARKMLQGKEKPRDDIPCTTCSIYLNRKKHNNWVTR